MRKEIDKEMTQAGHKQGRKSMNNKEMTQQQNGNRMCILGIGMIEIRGDMEDGRKLDIRSNN